MIGKILDTLFPSRVRARVEKENRLEEIRFNKFLEDKKKREDEKHPNAKMAEGVSKCSVGRFWVEKDYLDLIGAIALVLRWRTSPALLGVRILVVSTACVCSL